MRKSKAGIVSPYMREARDPERVRSDKRQKRHIRTNFVHWLPIAQLLLAGLLGAIVGAERSWSGRPSAGVRTCLLIAAGSCVFTLLSVEMATGDAHDKTRIAAQIVTGIGFLGAGAILQRNDRILGLTTAASIWITAAIGMAAGVGAYAIAVAATVMAAVVLPLLIPISNYIEKKGDEMNAGKREKIED